MAHLAEVEARGIHRLRACSSIYTYCVYELRMSEDAAYRRARAARVARRFPVIFRQVADGELHLTALVMLAPHLVMLAPHLTEENHLELLALAKHRKKADRALLDDLARHPERREPPLGWGLQFFARGDVWLHDDRVVTLDELCQQVGNRALPYVEAIEPDVALE